MTEVRDICDALPPFDSRTPWPRGVYRLRIIEAKREISSTDKPMVTCKIEVTGVALDTELPSNVELVGTQFKHWFTLSAGGAAMNHGLIQLGKSLYPKNEDAHEFFGTNVAEKLADKFESSKLTGLDFVAELHNETTESRQKLTPEDVLAGKKKGELKIDGETGKPLWFNQPSIFKFLRV